MKHQFFFFLVLFSISHYAVSQIKLLQVDPIVKVTIRLEKDSFATDENIAVEITLTNNTNVNQECWFDRPKSSTGGPAWTSVILENIETGESPLKYGNKAILSSQAHDQKTIKKYFYYLKPGEKLSAKYSLYNLVVLKSKDQRLPKGYYNMQVIYSQNKSAIVNFRII